MKYWYKIHKWTSLICAIFLFIMCFSALPLIFGREIAAFNQVSNPANSVVATAAAADLSVSRLAETAVARYPGYDLRAIYLDHVNQTIGFSLQGAGKGYQYTRLDLNTGQFVERANQQVKYEFIQQFINFMYRMHVDMYLGSFGRQLLGFMCGLSVVALISGLWLYAPFMKTVSFGSLRATSRRGYWVDWHKLLGIVTLSWTVLLSISGFIFVFAGPAHNAWNEHSRREFLQAYEGKPSPAQRISLDSALAVAKTALPDRRITGLELPQAGGKMPWHYTVRTQGDGFGAYLNQSVWVDAATGEITAIPEQPWYLQAFSMASPVHFSNHDTLPLKMLWFVTDFLTCIMIITGIYAWVVKFSPNTSKAAANRQPVIRPIRPVRQSLWQIWRLPAAIILLTLFGLIAPLAGSEWNNVSALALAIPLILTVYYWWRR